VSNIT